MAFAGPHVCLRLAVLPSLGAALASDSKVGLTNQHKCAIFDQKLSHVTCPVGGYDRMHFDRPAAWRP